MNNILINITKRYFIVCFAIFFFGLSLMANAQAVSLCKDRTAASLLAKASPYHDIIERYAYLYGVDIDLVKSVITVESCFRPKAVSHAGAQGLMQLMPATARRFGVKNSFSTVQNIRGGIKYLRFLQKRYSKNMTKVLAGYNAGEGNVDKYGGIPPFKETQHYVRNVLKVYSKLSPSAAVRYAGVNVSGFGANAGVSGRAWGKTQIDPTTYHRNPARVRSVYPVRGSQQIPKGKVDPVLISRTTAPRKRVRGQVANLASRKKQAHRAMAAEILYKKKSKVMTKKR